MNVPLTIISAEITAMPKEFGDPMPKVIATFTDGSVEELFEYYPDELSFSASEFRGLTKEQGTHLKFIKDKQFLQS